MAKLLFNGRVAIVTGAGGGLGRTYALELARRGASVVVNDLGGDKQGRSSAVTMADKVVLEIKNLGGIAVANYDSVEFGDKIIKTAIDNFGRIDIVINNAGILRDISFLKMTENDWDLIIKVHLKGAYLVTKAAWPYMRQQNYGRLLFTSSNSGVYGSFGQVNYSSAKTGLIGLAKALALEGSKYNILSNVIIPTAASRLTENILPEDLLKLFVPKHVTPLVTYLSHENCTENGKIYEAGAGWYGTVEYYRSKGKVLPSASAEDIEKNWNDIKNMESAKNFPSSMAVLDSLTEMVEKNKSKI